MMTTILAVALFLVVAARAICVLYLVTTEHHAGWRLVAFGASYVALGGGAFWSMLSIISRPDLMPLALWMMLAGSVGLIVFDRRHP